MYYCVPLHNNLRRGGETRNVEHFAFTAWPDHGVPVSTADMILLRDSVRATCQALPPGPVVVHCSAGVGRSGAFIAIDRALQEVEAGVADIDIRAIVADMRNNRNMMVRPIGIRSLMHKGPSGGPVCVCLPRRS